MKGGLHTRYRALSAKVSTRGSHKGAVATDGQNTGFTIVEVLIVLAITGGLFVSAAVMISGRTAKTQFQQAINQMTGQISQQINDVATGYYPNQGNVACGANGADINITTGTRQQGTNDGCVFLGKALYFGIANTDPEQYAVFPMAALQRSPAGDEITTYTAAKPAVIYPTQQHPNAPNGSQTTPLQYGLKVSKMYYNDNPSNAIAGVAFLNSLGTYNGSELVSGSQQVSLVPILNTPLNRTVGEAAQNINTNIVNSANTVLGPSGGVSICFDSGTTEQSGLVTIGGGGGRQLSVTLSIKGNKGC